MMTSLRSTFILITAIVAFAVTTDAYVIPPTFTRTVSNNAVMMAKGRKGSLRKNAGGSNGKGPGMGGSKGLGKEMDMRSSKSANWVPVKGISSVNDLPTEDAIKLVDTNAEDLMDVGTNPNGAVCVVGFAGKTYCCAVSCPTCKIPMDKALVLPPNDETGDDPRMCCNFCKSTYNLRTGSRLENAESAGLVGGIVKGLFSSSDKDSMKTYELGEKKG